ncbi:hypothetical protein FRB95_014889 [Tulasnella sp. JGI-2019a]|nr:hypothetical protein FRB95_014889 [Tulasnella sp. JGI-2019a]
MPRMQAGPLPSWGLGLASPRQLVQYLDSFVVGQERAKKILSVAVFNHYNRVRANQIAYEDAPAASAQSDSFQSESSSQPIIEVPPYDDQDDSGPSRATVFPHPHRRFASPHLQHLQPRHVTPLFEKSNVLIVGPTGSGKTLLAKTLARVLDVPFATSDATSLTQAGYVGEDVESVIQRLLQAANGDVRRASMGIVHIDEADKLARRGGPSSNDGGRDVSGEGVQQALLRMLEGSIVNVKGTGFENNTPPSSGTSPWATGADTSTIPPAERVGRRKSGSTAASGSSPKTDTYQVDTTDILFIISGAFVGMDKIIRNRVAKGSIGFGAPIVSQGDDSFLKQLSSRSTSSSTSEASTGAGFMPFFTPNDKDMDIVDLVEPADFVTYGFIPEFTSRLPSIAVLHPLSVSDLFRVLTEVRGALAKQYQALFGYSGIEIRFTTAALKEVCNIAAKRGGGARGLRGIMESLLLEPMYECPGSSVRYVLVDRSVVLGERPAHYWSRSEGAAFYSMLAAEESQYAEETIAEEGITEEAESEVDPVLEEEPVAKRRVGGSNFP